MKTTLFSLLTVCLSCVCLRAADATLKAPPADIPTNPSTLKRHPHNQNVIGQATGSSTTFGEFLRKSTNMLLVANVPNFQLITNGSTILTTTFSVDRASLPDAQYRATASVWLVMYQSLAGPPHLTVIDPDEISNLIAFIEFARSRAATAAEHPNLYVFATRGGFRMTIWIPTKGRLATDLTIGDYSSIGLPEEELGSFESAARRALASLSPKPK
jgi:hypothetical protein